MDSKYLTNVSAAFVFSVLPISPGYFNASEVAFLKIDATGYYIPAACKPTNTDPIAQMGKHWTDAGSDSFFVSVPK